MTSLTHARHVPAPRPTSRRRRPRKPAVWQWFVHESGRFDRPLTVWRASILRLRGYGTVITGTESASTRTRAEVDQALGGQPDWAYAHLTGHDGEGECYATWDTRSRRLVASPYAVQLTTETWVRSPEYGGKPAAHTHALVVPLGIPDRPHRRTQYVIVVHMPLNNTELRAHIWKLCAAGLRDHVTHLRAVDPTCEIVIVADWNRDWRRPAERVLLAMQVAAPLKLAQVWDRFAPSTGGTFGDHLIDGALTDVHVNHAELLPDDDSSDHRPWRYHVRARLRPRTLRHVVAHALGNG